jgi:hypothetical protein
MPPVRQGEELGRLGDYPLFGEETSLELLGAAAVEEPFIPTLRVG